MDLVHLGRGGDGQNQGELSQRIEDLIVQGEQAGYEATSGSLL